MASIEDNVLAEEEEQVKPSTLADPTNKKDMTTFNSQTSYVPKTKIITVAFSSSRQTFRSLRRKLIGPDIPSLCER